MTKSAPHLTQFCDRASYGTDLGVSKLPQRFEGKYGFPGCGVKRTALNLALKEAVRAAGIPVHEGWKLKNITEKNESVVALSEDGREVEGSFLIGCDGIKAVSRSLILKEHGTGEETAEYTGLTQVGLYFTILACNTDLQADCWNVPNSAFFDRSSKYAQCLRPKGTFHLLPCLAYNDFVGSHSTRFDGIPRDMADVFSLGADSIS